MHISQLCYWCPESVGIGACRSGAAHHAAGNVRCFACVSLCVSVSALLCHICVTSLTVAHTTDILFKSVLACCSNAIGTMLKFGLTVARGQRISRSLKTLRSSWKNCLINICEAGLSYCHRTVKTLTWRLIQDWSNSTYFAMWKTYIVIPRCSSLRVTGLSGTLVPLGQLTDLNRL